MDKTTNLESVASLTRGNYRILSKSHRCIIMSSVDNRPNENVPELSEEPTAGSEVPTIAICEKCRNLNPKDAEFSNPYVWSSSLPSSAPTSCQFCQFIYDAAISMVPSLASEPQIHASLQSPPEHNRIDLGFGGRLSMQIYSRPSTLPVLRLWKHARSTVVNRMSRTEIHHHPKSHKPCADLTDISRDDSFDFVLNRLQHCKQNHPRCSQPNAIFHPSRLIHCADMNGQLQLREYDEMVPDSSPIRYVALSYCWGSSALFKTTRTNIDRLKQRFSLSDLPKTIQDAIRVTQRLGIPYIWIDALCIVQDDAADWEKESGMMADVYSNAHVTLAALSAAPVTEGFLHLRRSPVRLTRTWSGGNGVTTVLVAQEKIRTGLHASSLQDDWSPVLGIQEGDYDPVQKRGWCFQEEILSRRFLAYSRHEIQWSCRTELVCQCRPLDYDGNPGAITQTRNLQDNPFQFWAEMLPFYSNRSLTFPNDKLPAISGLARQIQRVTSADYVAGIWLNDLKRSLNWKPQDDITSCPATYRAPSFSWASIDSPIFVATAADCLPDTVFVVSWDVQPRGQDPFGEIKHASLTLSGFVHAAIITHVSDVGYEYRVSIANESALLDEDTHLAKFQTRDVAGDKCWSVRRSNHEVKYGSREWGPGVTVRAICLGIGETAAEFLVLGQCPYDATKLERIGSATFTAAISSFRDFVRGLTRDCHRQTVTLV